MALRGRVVCGQDAVLSHRLSVGFEHQGNDSQIVWRSGRTGGGDQAAGEYPHALEARDRGPCLDRRRGLHLELRAGDHRLAIVRVAARVSLHGQS